MRTVIRVSCQLEVSFSQAQLPERFGWRSRGSSGKNVGRQLLKFEGVWYRFEFLEVVV